MAVRDPFVRDPAAPKHRPERASVRDDENLALRMSRSNVGQCVDHALVELLRRLVIAPRPVVGLREAGENLLVEKTLPGAEAPLAKVMDRHDRQAAGLRDGARGVESTSQVAGVDGIDSLALELVCKRPRLRDARLVQRPVRMSLDASLGVPIGLAVSCQEDRRHGLYASSPWIWGSPTEFASSPARRAGSGSSPPRCLPPRVRRSSSAAATPAASSSLVPAPAQRSASSATWREPSAPEQLIGEATRALGRVDCLVNNVGLAYQADFEELSDEQWDEMWQLNVMSFARSIRAVLPGMRERGRGVIVNVSSTSGKRPSTSMPNYSVTKAAVLSLSRLVADLYAKDGIRSNAITPGPDGNRGLARARRARRPAGGADRASRATRCSRRSRRAARSVGWRSRRRSPR